MEFRQVMHSVCRTAASTATATVAAAASASTTSAAVRPTLARATAPALSSFLLYHHRSFTTNNRQQHEAVAVAARPQQTMPHPPPIGQFQQRQPAGPKAGLPPRPPSAKTGLLDFRAQVVRAPSLSRSQAPTPTTRSKAAGWAVPILRGRTPSRSGTNPMANMSALIASDMHRSTTGGNIVTWDVDKFKDESFAPEPELRLRPSTGRTVEVKGTVDFARGLRLLQSITAVNNLRTDVRLQRFHERPALKRKRKLREGWRSRFRDGFNATKRRVFELKAQGW